mmetsp:Transcript_22696/g.47091  ORF Transcript_22696/g.47091 Transcript_22696/m.47091 type:complete len:476 (-) Transcript_22696:1378-2805(-)
MFSSRRAASLRRRLVAVALLSLLLAVGCAMAGDTTSTCSNESGASDATSCAAEGVKNVNDDKEEAQPNPTTETTAAAAAATATTTITAEMAAEASSWSSPDAKNPDALIPSNDGYQPPPYDTVLEHSDFLMPPLRPGELKMLRFNENFYDGGKYIAQNYAARIGLPKHAMAVLRKYASDLGALDEMKRTHYHDPLEPNSGRFFKSPPAYSGGRELKWYIQRPGKHYDSDLHWFGCGDEWTHESFLRAMADAGLDAVLDAIADEFDLDGLTIQGVGFLSATYGGESFMHWDWSNTGGRAFNILIPLEQVPGSGPELYVSDREVEDDPEGVDGEIKLHPSYGVLLGDDSYHGTHECDHRPTGKIRASVSIYLADLTPENVMMVASDPTAIFPLPHSYKWLWTQRGRHWGDGRSMADDIGRISWQPVDFWDDCAKLAADGECEVSNAHETRNNCQVTCKVFIPDDEYQLGVPRSKIFY